MKYVPDSADLIWLDFNPQAGHEQAGQRPALVLSPLAYNRTVGLALVCPITSRVKGYPFEVELKTKMISGAVLADHVKSVDWNVRRAKFIETVSLEILLDVTAKLQTLLPKP